MSLFSEYSIYYRKITLVDSVAERNRGRPAKISFEQIVEAALHIGLEELSMTRLARELGVAMSTLYHHVPGIDAVNAAVADRLIGDVDALIEAGEETELRSLLLEVGRSLRMMFQSAPGLAAFAGSTPRLRGRILAVHEKAVQRLVNLGLDPMSAFLAVRVIADYVEASTARDELWHRQGDVVESMAENRREALASGHSVMAQALGGLPDNYLDAQFDAGLAAIAAGIDQELARER